MIRILEWWLPALVLIVWAAYCHQVRSFPLWIVAVEIALAVLLMTVGVLVHFLRIWLVRT